MENVTKKAVNLPGYLWVKVIDGAAHSLEAGGRESNLSENESAKVDTKDPGRPPYLTEIGVGALKSKAKLEFAPFFPEHPFWDVDAADIWRGNNPTWFNDAHSVHLIKVDA